MLNVNLVSRLSNVVVLFPPKTSNDDLYLKRRAPSVYINKLLPRMTPSKNAKKTTFIFKFEKLSKKQHEQLAENTKNFEN